MISLVVALIAAEEPNALRELKQLEERIRICQGIERLKLTPQQREALCPLIEESQGLVSRYVQDAGALLKEQKESFTAFRAEDEKNVGFTPQIEKCAAEADHRGDALKRRMAKDIEPIEKEVLALLTPDQRRLICPKEDKDPESAQSQLREMLKERHGELSPLGKALLSPTLAKAVGASSTDMEKVEQAMREVSDVREDINLLNLLNGMYFSAHQLEHLLKEWRSAHGEDSRARREDAINEVLPELRQAIERFEAGEPLPKDVEKKLQKVRRSLMSQRREGGVDDIREILFEPQREVLTDYNPCLIPPKNLKDPVRVGQSDDGERSIKMLERFRKIPKGMWERRKEEILDKAVQEAQKRGVTMSEKEREEGRAKLAELLERVRTKEDVDFELAKPDLAKEVKALDKFEQLKEQVRSMTSDEQALTQKIRQNLLHPRAGPLLEARLRQTREFEIDHPVDLDRISPAPSCRDGHCAIKEGH